jgi:hypothetical protein
MIRAKGVFFLNFKKQASEQDGPQAVADAIASLSPEDQAVFAQPISAVSWVDYGALMRLILQYHKGSIAALKEGSIMAARENLKGIYRTFISLTSPKFVCNRIPLVWKQYFDQGELALQWADKNNLSVRITGVTDMPRYHEYNFMPFLEEALRISGARSVLSHHSKCLAKGDDCCQIDFRWN